MSQQFFESDSPYRENFPAYCSFCGSRFLLNDTRCQKCDKLRRRPTKISNIHWKKVLYERQPFDDNYLDETFLSSLVSQETSARLTYPQVVIKAMEVSLATSFVSLYLLIYMSMLSQWVDSKVIVMINISILLTGSLVFIKLKKIFLNLKAGVIVIGSLLIFSPLIETFYKNYASNTTYAISYGLIVIHLVFKDYAYVYSKESAKIKMDWSTLAIMYLTVIMGSRLQGGPIQTFTLWLSTLTLFVFSRVLQKSLREYSVKAYNWAALSFIIGLAVVIYNISKISIIVYMLINFVIFFIGPLVLVWFYQYKNVIHGPWDLPNIKQHEE